MANKVSVILPVYKTSQYLKELNLRLCEVFRLEGFDYELIYIDDASPDNAWEILQTIAKQNIRVKIIKLSRNFGQHPAIAAALDHLTGDQIILMDTDLQDRPEDIPMVLKELNETHQVVYTRKANVNCESWFVRVTSKIYHDLISKSISCSVPKNIGTFRAFSKKFSLSISKYQEHGILFGPLMFHAGFQYRVIDVYREERTQGRSGYTFSKRLNLAINSLVSYTDLPYRWMLNLGLATILGSLIYAILVVLFYLLNRDVLLPGLNLIVFLLTLIFGTMMIGLGVIGIYVFRIYQEVLRRPRYLIEDTLNFFDS